MNNANPYAVAIGARLRQLRLEHKLTQPTVAGRAGCSNTSINQYELGHNLPRIDILARLAAIYGVTLDSLVMATDDLAA